MQFAPASEVDLKVLKLQLGRVPRGVLGIAARCKCGAPLVVATAPRLENGNPFPTMFYLTHPQAVKGCSVLESNQWMEMLNERLATDEELRRQYADAHRAYIEAREAVEYVEEIKDFSAGGMPTRVKCLHALLGHALAAGRGVNPIGDWTRDKLAEMDLWTSEQCSCLPGQTPADFEGEVASASVNDTASATQSVVEGAGTSELTAEGATPSERPDEARDESAFPWHEGAPLKRVAGIDCGTNSIRLLIGEKIDGEFVDYAREMRIVRLGEGVDRTGVLSPEAIARTVEQTRVYAQMCREANVTRLRFVATSASRDARNRAEFQAGIREAIGVEPEVVEGVEEAKLSFTGAVGSLTGIPTPAMIVDIGGGSTEFVAGSPNDIDGSISMNMGSVRVAEKFPEVAAPNPDTSRAQAWIDGLIDEAEQAVPFESISALVGVAGTVTTITCHALGLDGWDPQAVHGARFSFEQMIASCDYMINASVEELAALSYMPEGREDVISGGALIWRQILRRAAGANPRLRALVSEHDILDGIALSLLEH